MSEIVIKKLLDNRVMVEPFLLEGKTPSGIILPGNVGKEKQGAGTILMLGEKVVSPRPEDALEVGQEVLYGKMAGFEMDYNGKTVKILRDADISAILT